MDCGATSQFTMTDAVSSVGGGWRGVEVCVTGGTQLAVNHDMDMDMDMDMSTS